MLSTFPDGVFFVDLSALHDPALVIPALAQTLALKETLGRTLQQSLAAHLSSKDMLLILDNFEQVIEAAPEVSALLTEAPALKLVVTSREALRIEGERVVSLAPLELPSQDHDDVDEVARSAVRSITQHRPLRGCFTGLLPSEHSSGAVRRQGPITKTGNRHVRRVLAEAAWTYRHRPYMTAALNRRSEGQPPEVLAYCWAAQLRLCPATGISPQKATTMLQSSPWHESSPVSCEGL